MLKHYYRQEDGDVRNYTFKNIFEHPKFLQDFGLQKNAITTSAKTLQEIYHGISGKNSIHTAFCTAAKLRNTTGHNLIWDDVFSDPEVFKALCDQVMNAVFYVVATKAH